MRLVGRPVECTERDCDRYARIVAVCRVAGAGLNVPDRDENAATNIEAEGLRVVIRPEDPGGLRAFGDERRCSDGARACGRVSANSEAVSLSGTG